MEFYTIDDVLKLCSSMWLKREKAISIIVKEYHEVIFIDGKSSSHYQTHPTSLFISSSFLYEYRWHR